MTDFYGRNVELVYTVDNKDYTVDQLHMQWDIDLTNKKTPNQMTLTVYNINESSRRLLASEYMPVKFSFGRDDEKLVQLFRGESKMVSSKYESPNWITVIKAGEKEKDYTQLFLSKTYSSGTNVGIILSDLADMIGCRLNVDGEISFVNLSGACTFHCMLHRALTEITKDYDLIWHIQNDQLYIEPEDKSEWNTIDVLTYSFDAGLLNSPELVKGLKKDKTLLATIKCKTLLDTRVKIGSYITFEKVTFDISTFKDVKRIPKFDDNSYFRVTRVHHIGANFGKECYTEIEAKYVG
jgi:hypothetical protein